MPFEPIPFTSLNKSADKPEQYAFNQDQKDGYWQEYVSPDGPRLIWAKRPGLTLFSDLVESYAVDGLHFWVRQGQLIASCNSKLFRITSGGVASDVTGTATDIEPGVRPTFADALGTNLYVAASGNIAELPAASSAADLTDAQAPPSVRFIAVLNQVLIALNDAAERFDWADAGAPTNWAGLYATAQSLPDLAKSLHVANGYVYIHGQNSLEAWRDDGSTFVREAQGVLQRGTNAHYSVKEINGVFYWLDHTREVSRLNGFSIEVISNPALSRYLNQFTTIEDARGDYLKVEGRHFYVLSFPTEGKTLVFDIGLQQWYEWGYYNSTTAAYDAFIPNCIVDAPAWNKVLAGSRTTGKIYEIAGTDDDGDAIRTLLRTDFVDRGNPDTWKTCNELVLLFKRADTTTTPKTMTIKWRDDGSTTWQTSRDVEIEAQSATELKVNTRRLGHYKRRQWEFVMSDATQAALTGAWERYTVGR